jgi:phosphatidylinositol-3-phosphatase
MRTRQLLAAVLTSVVATCGVGVASVQEAPVAAAQASHLARATKKPKPMPTPTATTPTPTSSQSVTPTVTKVLTFVEENHSLSQMQLGMPYTYGLAKQYGYATNWSAITHPSLPNYLAMTGGSTYGVTDDGSPASHRVRGPNAFGEAIAAGNTAKSYQESMTSNCLLTNSGRYAVKHNPWAYFTDDRTNCAKFDVPSGTTTSGALHNDIVSGTLPNVGEVTPNLDNDAHDGSLLAADNWIKSWMTQIFASADWKSGHLAIIITADEDNGSQGNRVLTTVIHPSQNHRVVSTALTHYSWTKAMTDLAKAPCLGAGCNAADAVIAFGLPLG